MSNTALAWLELIYRAETRTSIDNNTETNRSLHRLDLHIKARTGEITRNLGREARREGKGQVEQ